MTSADEAKESTLACDNGSFCVNLDKPSISNDLIGLDSCPHSFCIDCLGFGLSKQTSNTHFKCLLDSCGNDIGDDVLDEILQKSKAFRRELFQQRKNWIATAEIGTRPTDVLLGAPINKQTTEFSAGHGTSTDVDESFGRNTTQLENGDYKPTSKQIELAAVYLNDALHYRQCKLKPRSAYNSILFGLTRIQLYKFSQEWYWVEGLFVMIWANMLKAFWEPPGVTRPSNVC